MRRPDDDALLVDMLVLAKRVRLRVEGITWGNFEADENLQLAVVPLIQNVGEAASRESQEFRARHVGIPWPEMIGMRNHLVHDYLRVSAEVAWMTALEDIPALIAAIEPLVPDAEPGEQP